MHHSYGGLSFSLIGLEWGGGGIDPPGRVVGCGVDTLGAGVHTRRVPIEPQEEKGAEAV